MVKIPVFKLSKKYSPISLVLVYRSKVGATNFTEIRFTGCFESASNTLPSILPCAQLDRLRKIKATKLKIFRIRLFNKYEEQM